MSHSSQQPPIVLIFGPSGVGKSTLAEWVAEDLDFLHINFDFWDQKGQDGETIREVWRDFLHNGSVHNFRKEIQKQIETTPHKGAVLSFVSKVFLSLEQIVLIRNEGICPIFLFGSQEECLKSFLEREKKIDRNLPTSHWDTWNKEIYSSCLHKKEYEPYIERAFERGVRRTRESLVEAVRSRLSA